VGSLLKQCDVAVLASSSEGLPLAIIEYGLAGIATVATDVGQCADVLDHGNVGLLVPPRDPSSLAAALMKLLNDRALRNALGRTFKAFVTEHYAAQKAMDEIVSTYCKILGCRSEASSCRE
jgi:glycosyltransferase involved in cell wall biosynthesis